MNRTGKRLLILFDNAATADQVEPLLPRGTPCTVLITSRHPLPSLTARHGARPVHIGVLTDAEARTLLHAAPDDTHESADTERATTNSPTRNSESSASPGGGHGGF